MQLPKIQTPIFNIEIPSIKKTKKFRPFLVKEEKILLLAQQGNDSDLLDAITQIINNCCLEDLNISSLASFDLEYIFLKLRARSVNNLVELKYKDKEDDKIYTFEVDLDFVSDLVHLLVQNERKFLQLLGERNLLSIILATHLRSRLVSCLYQFQYGYVPSCQT